MKMYACSLCVRMRACVHLRMLICAHPAGTGALCLNHSSSWVSVEQGLSCLSGAPRPRTSHLSDYFLWPLWTPIPFLQLNFQIDFPPRSQVLHFWLFVPSCWALVLEGSFRNSDRQTLDKWHSWLLLAFKWCLLLFLSVAQFNVVFCRLPACL